MTALASKSLSHPALSFRITFFIEFCDASWAGDAIAFAELWPRARGRL